MRLSYGSVWRRVLHYLCLLGHPLTSEVGALETPCVRAVHECMQLQVEEASCVQIYNDTKTLLHVLFTK